MANRYNIAASKKYIKDGEEKTSWQQVGKLVYFPATEEKEAGFIFELSMFPTTSFKVFPEKDHEVRPAPQPVERQPVYEYPADEIRPEDIPF